MRRRPAYSTPILELCDRPVFSSCYDGRRIGARAVRADLVRGEQRLLPQHLAEEALGGLQIALGGEEVDRLAVLVDGAVQIPPLTTDLDVRFVDPDRAAMGF